MPAIGAILRDLRNARGATVQQVCALASFSPSAYTRIENEATTPQLHSVKRLIVAMDEIVPLTNSEMGEISDASGLSTVAILHAIGRGGTATAQKTGAIPRSRVEPDSSDRNLGPAAEVDTEVDVRALADPATRRAHAMLQRLIDGGADADTLAGLLEHLGELGVPMRAARKPEGMIYIEEHPPRQSPGEDLPRKATVLKRYPAPEPTPGESRTGRRKSS